MQRVRKNSLSPCYSNMNKENLAIQNYNSPIGISFKNLQEVRKKKTIQQSHTNKVLFNNQKPQNFVKPTTPIAANHTKNKQKTPLHKGEASKRQTDRSIDDIRQSLKSKQKQMGSLHSQVHTLNTTVSLLKQQLSCIKNQNKILNDQNQQLKIIMKDKNQLIDKLKKQKSDSKVNALQPILNQSSQKKLENEECQKCKKNQKAKQDYDEVIDKLNELEQIQNKLLQQNENLKKKQNMNKAMFKNLKTLLSGNRLQEISDLLSVLID